MCRPPEMAPDGAQLAFKEIFPGDVQDQNGKSLAAFSRSDLWPVYVLGEKRHPYDIPVRIMTGVHAAAPRGTLHVDKRPRKIRPVRIAIGPESHLLKKDFSKRVGARTLDPGLYSVGTC